MTSPNCARRHAPCHCAGTGDPEEISSIEEITCGGVPARLYRPAGDDQAALVWLHGGGWMLCDPACYDTMARALADRASCAVLSVDYRRAPEHRYPAATDDAWRATRWAFGQFGQVAVGGDSSGGNLAAAVALRARDHGLSLAMQLLIYPVLDADPDASYREDFAKRHEGLAGPAVFGIAWRDNMQYIWQQYVPDPALRRDADASPMRAASLASLAPAFSSPPNATSCAPRPSNTPAGSPPTASPCSCATTRARIMASFTSSRPRRTPGMR